MLGFFRGGRLGAVGLLRGEIADKQVEPAVAVPIDGADLGTDAAPRLFGGIGTVMGLARWYELYTRGQLRGLGGADIAVEPDTAVAGADKQVDLPIAVPVTGKRPGVAVRDLDRFAAGHQ